MAKPLRAVTFAVLVLLLSACAWHSRHSAPFRGIAYLRYAGSGRSDLWLVRHDGGAKRLVARNASAPLISPDGRWIAYAKCIAADYCAGVHLASTRGLDRRVLARGVTAGAWTPDSEHLLGTAPLPGEGRYALVRVDLADEKVTRLVNRPIGQFAIAPSGRQVCVAIQRGDKSDLYVVGVDGKGLHRITHGGASDFPVWGTHGIAFRHLVRHGTFPRLGWGADEVWRIGPDGRGARRIARPPASVLGSGITGLAPVAWSADGLRLVAALTNEFGGPPFAVNPRTGSVRQIGSYSYHAWPAALSRDGMRVLVEDTAVELGRSTRVEVVSYAGGRPHVVARFAGSPAWNE